jgi:hypothetical protein
MKPSQRRPVFTSVPGRPDLQRFIGFEGDPGTVRRRKPNPVPRVFKGLGSLSGSNASDRGGYDIPSPDGTPGPGMIYNESEVWGTSGSSATVLSPPDGGIVATTPDNSQVDCGLSIPFGISIVPWRNPTTFQSVPIISSTPVNTPVLSLNMARNALTIQNNSSATSPDVAPNFYIGFNAQPQAGLSLTLAPGAGILFDIICPRDAIYVLIAGGTGASQVIQGVVVQGTYAPI